MGHANLLLRGMRNELRNERNENLFHPLVGPLHQPRRHKVLCPLWRERQHHGSREDCASQTHCLPQVNLVPRQLLADQNSQRHPAHEGYRELQNTKFLPPLAGLWKVIIDCSLSLFPDDSVVGRDSGFSEFAAHEAVDLGSPVVGLIAVLGGSPVSGKRLLALEGIAVVLRRGDDRFRGIGQGGDVGERGEEVFRTIGERKRKRGGVVLRSC